MADNIFTTEDFDPVKVLTGDFLAPPDLAAPIYNNVDAFVASLTKQKADEDAAVAGAPVQKRVSLPVPAPATRRFLPEQGPSGTERPERRPPRNVFSWMDTKEKGPLTLLQDCMANRLKVKVWTRGAVTVRGFCVGFISAFDKHWNLALTDVDEVFARKSNRKSLPLGDVDSISLAGLAVSLSGGMPVKNDRPFESCQRLASGKSDDEEIYTRGSEKKKNPMDLFTIARVIEKTKGSEICERHVKQLLVRGEQIVMIAVLSGNTGIE